MEAQFKEKISRCVRLNPGTTASLQMLLGLHLRGNFLFFPGHVNVLSGGSAFHGGHLNVLLSDYLWLSSGTCFD